MYLRFSRGKAAVSPVVSDVIMVFVTVAAFSILYGVSSQWMIIQRINEMQVIRERLIIEDAWFMPSPNNQTIRLVITNVGRIDAKVKYVQVNNVELWKSGGGEPVDVERGSSIAINVTLASSWVPDERYEITIITDRGNEFEAVFWSPAD